MKAENKAEQAPQEEEIIEEAAAPNGKVLVPEILTEEEKEKMDAEGADPLCDADFFYNNVFKMAFDLSGKILGLNSLPIMPHEEAAARATSDEVFRLIEKYEVLGFMRKACWIERYSLVALFGWQKYSAMKAEIEARRQVSTTPEEGKQAEEQPKDCPLG